MQALSRDCRSLRAHGTARLPFRCLPVCRAADKKTESLSTPVDTLDQLLGTTDDNKQREDAQLVPWWQIKPKQSAPPRQALMHPPGEVARFVADSSLYAQKVRSGRSTQIGGELDLPQVEPYFCYLLMALQLAVYAAGTWLAVSQGPGAGEQWALALALEPSAVLQQHEGYRLASCLLLHGNLTHLALDTFFLGWMGPGIEALLGHGLFLFIYLFSGLSGSAAVLLFSGGTTDPVAGATAGAVGLIGAMVGFELLNTEIVRQSLGSRRSKAEDGKQGSSALRKPLGGVAVVGLMLLLSSLPSENMLNNSAHVGGLLAGVALGYALGPSFILVREVDIPEGSMQVPDNAAETVVVLDRRGTFDRLVGGAAALGLLGAVLAAATQLPPQ